ncbi:MAG: hypothetical protein LRY73_07230 [Bacillus sp. (in: Bacteria)]|nr:hypothetical protein [Bacillus sp. (in: firmicutes)]
MFKNFSEAAKELLLLANEYFVDQTLFLTRTTSTTMTVLELQQSDGEIELNKGDILNYHDSY